ncbi:MAG TPA: histidine--tRNA ligase [Bacillota bacterium]|nr:histidine--tRNA ligase [Bacillota bacterium]
MIQRPRGTFDILPEEMPYWYKIEETAREVSALYGFSEIRIPTFEATELFARGVGDTTDVVQKEMYTFTDREGRSLTLRPEGTAGVARALIENGKCSDAMPLKLFYIINCFRYEKPQAGRSREFYQYGVELFGSDSPAADATVIALANAVISRLGITGTELQVNSIGCPSCRPEYHKKLREFFAANEEKLCPTCRERLKTNPLRILDCKNEDCIKLCEGAPKVLDSLCSPCAEHFETLKKYLDASGIAYTVNPKIVRGLDYYTRTVFEFISDKIGAQSTICGGGRYDGLIKQIGGPELPGIGFAMGITRLILAMKACGSEVEEPMAPSLYIAPLGERAQLYALKLSAGLKEAGIYSECDIVGRSLKSQMKYADKIGAKYTLILGDAEIDTGRAILKNMQTGEQSEVGVSDIDALRRLLS